MIRKLRRKFIVILMCVATLILLAVFVSLAISTWNNSRRLSENMLRQALYMPQAAQGLRASPAMDGQNPEGVNPLEGRTSILVAEIDESGTVTLLSNQLHYMSEEEATSAVQAAMNDGGIKGTLSNYGMRWMKSEDGRRIALADISMEMDMLRTLIINSLMIGGASLAAFFFISLFLANWTVRPVERAWERQRQFVADASHELKTPLTVILSNAEMLSGNGSFNDDKKARRMEHIRAEAMIMKKLVEDLLTLAKTDSAEPVKIKERVDFSFIVTSAVLTFEPIAFDERKVLTYNVHNDIFITGDTQRLNQLIGILLDNAVKYCPPGGRISVVLTDINKKTAMLTVTNDGEPIPSDELRQVFARFYRVDKSRSAPGSFGLGLSIAQSIAAEHNGRIWAESGRDAGNRFFVVLPVNS